MSIEKLSTEDDLVCHMADFPGPLVLAPCGGESLITAAASFIVSATRTPLLTRKRTLYAGATINPTS